MIITNPEKECAATPSTFSGKSVITEVKKEEHRSGIILDNDKEFAAALRMYSRAGGSARAAKNDLVREQEGMAAAFMLYAEAMAGDHSDSFTEHLIQEALPTLEASGKFCRSIDYDGFGTNFFKTNVDGKKVDGKYILGLYSGSAGSKIEEELAVNIGKTLALVNTTVKGMLSVVDDWWFNVNLEEALTNLPIPHRKLRGLPEYIASGGYRGKKQEITWKYENQKLILSIGLDANVNLMPEGGNYKSRYMQIRDKCIVGGAWTTWENGNKIAPKAAQPAVGVAVSLPNANWYSSNPAVAEEQMRLLQSARDYLAGLLK